MTSPPKTPMELSKERSELEQLFERCYHGWGRGVVVTNDGAGNFSERPMTPLELEARYVATEIGTNIHRHASHAAFAPIIIFQAIQDRKNARGKAVRLPGFTMTVLQRSGASPMAERIKEAM